MKHIEWNKEGLWQRLAGVSVFWEEMPWRLDLKNRSVPRMKERTQQWECHAEGSRGRQKVDQFKELTKAVRLAYSDRGRQRQATEDTVWSSFMFDTGRTTSGRKEHTSFAFGVSSTERQIFQPWPWPLPVEAYRQNQCAWNGRASQARDVCIGFSLVRICV